MTVKTKKENLLSSVKGKYMLNPHQFCSEMTSALTVYLFNIHVNQIKSSLRSSVNY